VVLDSYLVTGEVKVVVDHIQRPMPQDLLEREDIPAGLPPEKESSCNVRLANKKRGGVK